MGPVDHLERKTAPFHALGPGNSHRARLTRDIGAHVPRVCLRQQGGINKFIHVLIPVSRNQQSSPTTQSPWTCAEVGRFQKAVGLWGPYSINTLAKLGTPMPSQVRTPCCQHKNIQVNLTTFKLHPSRPERLNRCLLQLDKLYVVLVKTFVIHLLQRRSPGTERVQRLHRGELFVESGISKSRPSVIPPEIIG